MAWRNCRASMTLIDTINARWPGRSKASDGTIGDAAHATRTSDHNPFVVLAGQGIVRARDITKIGIDAPWLAEELRRLGAAGDRRLRYVIFQRRITKPDFSGWKVYTGSNPHDKHIHVSFAMEPAGFDSTAPWPTIAGGTVAGLRAPDAAPALKFPVVGSIAAAFQRVGGLTVLGQPLGPEAPTADPKGRWQNFERGRIYWHPTILRGNAYAILGDIEQRFKALGFENGVGWPTTDESKCADGRGRYNHFLLKTDPTSIYWYPGIGAKLIKGAIRATWAGTGWEYGALGYPTGEETPANGGVMQEFQRGSILWKDGRAVLTRHS